ncbi:hypothetical protein Clacol_003283 [Clathrus columnatus]|uniref:Succinate dehydrogenase assembly factor 4, mitochondrial n=1 Tax=Clathrus columnatus TaxID=1419009 RepID=A0AAV5A316_9AGAM|nr:hypothetical protein Clacol_003283 [Clathrus columnatus]
MFRTRSYYYCLRQFIARQHSPLRFYSSSSQSSSPFLTPKPPPLPPKEQKEWEESMRRRQLSEASTLDDDLNSHPDARKPVTPDFEGDTNPVTGEIGGPKKEPLAWGANGEWTFGGRATDF